MMDETVQRQADEVVGDADLRHDLADVDRLARVVARCYRALVAFGTPEDLAGELTIQYQAMRLMRGALDAAGDGEA